MARYDRNENWGLEGRDREGWRSEEERGRRHHWTDREDEGEFDRGQGHFSRGRGRDYGWGSREGGYGVREGSFGGNYGPGGLGPSQSGWGQGGGGYGGSMSGWSSGATGGYAGTGGQDAWNQGMGGYSRENIGNESFDRAQGSWGQPRWGRSGRQQERGRFFGKGPKGYKRSDERIREEVSEELSRHPEIDASEIEVQVNNGEVTLTGTVNERHMKRMAEDVVEECFGVTDVHNNLKVSRATSDK